MYLQARVDQVHIQGCTRTKDSIFESSMNIMFTSNSFNNVCFTPFWFYNFIRYYLLIKFIFHKKNVLILL